MPNLSSLVTLVVVIKTTPDATIDDKVGILTLVGFQCSYISVLHQHLIQASKIAWMSNILIYNFIQFNTPLPINRQLSLVTP